jgi:hypothetical protein
MTAPRDVAADPGRWHEFVAQPARYIDAMRLVACFDGQFADDLCTRLKSCVRLRDRVSDLIMAHYGLASRVAFEACDETDRAIALASAEQLADLTLRCGAIYCSAAIANVILADQVAVLHEQLGEPLCGFAVAHRDLAGPVETVEALETLSQRVAENGWLCLGVWCHAQPREVGMRVRLKLAAREALDGEPAGHLALLGCAIVRRAAA